MCSSILDERRMRKVMWWRQAYTLRVSTEEPIQPWAKEGDLAQCSFRHQQFLERDAAGREHLPSISEGKVASDQKSVSIYLWAHTHKHPQDKFYHVKEMLNQRDWTSLKTFSIAKVQPDYWTTWDIHQQYSAHLMTHSPTSDFLKLIQDIV